MTTYTSVFGDDAIPAAEQSYASVSLTSDQAFYWSELSVGDFLLHDLMDIHSAGAYATDSLLAHAGQHRLDHAQETEEIGVEQCLGFD